MLLPQDAKKLISLLRSCGYKAYAVGGCVRDFLMGATPKDIDIATCALPEETEIVLKNADIKYIETGIKHGTVTAIVKPGEEKFPMAANRIILTARGDRISRLAGFKAGDNVSISVTVADNMGNTKKWQSVTNCVGGHMPIVIDGVSSEMADATAYPT